MTIPRPKTADEANNILIAELQANAALLRKATASGDRAAMKKYWDKATDIETKLRSTGLVGSIGSGLMSGVSGLLTGIPDLAIAGLNAMGVGQQNKPQKLSDLVTGTPPPTPIKSLGERLSAASGFVNEPTSQENAYAFRIAQGMGGSALPGAGAKTLLTGGALGAGDVALAQATGAPEGIVSGIYGSGAILKSLVRGGSNLLKDRKTQAFINDLPPDEANKFKEFMLKGQGSSDPTVNAAIQKLRNNPKYAELLSSLETGATTTATKGMAPIGRALTSEQDVTAGIVTRVQAEINGLKEKSMAAGSRSFEAAKGYGGDRNFIDPANTLEQVRKLKQDYAEKATPSADAATLFLRSLEVKLSSPKLSVEQTQSLLHEFGKKASQGDSLLKEVSLTDEIRISSAIFGGLKDDLKAARIASVTPEDKAATGLLLDARKQVADAVEKYQNSIAQGIPAYIKDKSLAQISYEDLYKQYKDLNPANRAAMRSYVSGTDKEALNFIDQNVYKDFVGSAQGKLSGGNYGTDLEKLSENWFSLAKNEKDALTTALGTNIFEFDQRMKDARIFNRKMQVTSKPAENLVDTGTQRSISASMGALAGYPVAKGTELSIDALNAIKKTGLNDDQLAKALFTAEGKDFLKNAALSPSSSKVLEELNKFTSSQPSPEGLSALSRIVPTTVTAPTTEAAPSAEDIYIPPDLMGPSGDVFIPEDLMSSFRNPAEQQIAQNVSNIDTSGPANQQADAINGIKAALASGALQGPDAAKAQALLQQLAL